MIEEFKNKISKLRTDKNRKQWSGLTNHQAPHKPFLLMSVIDHFAQGAITENFVDPSFDLVETFNIYWSSIMPPGARGNMAYPFPRLHNDGVWELIPNPGYEGKINIESISSMKKLREVCTGARFDDKLFQLMSRPDTREQLRAAIVNTYFAEEIRPKVIECGDVNIKAYEYSKELLKVAEKTEPFGQKEEKKIRDQGFRKAIVTLYEHRCAMCGIRMLTPEGHTVVEAAHVVPWSENYDDRPSNGMALCKLCHWSFDEGLMSVGEEYEVKVSKRVNLENNFPGHMLTLSDRSIFKPDEEKFWPGQENLDWHRGKVYFG